MKKKMTIIGIACMFLWSTILPIVSASNGEGASLFINAPDNVTEGTSFEVTVTDNSGNPVADAQVYFSDLFQSSTNQNGMVTIIAPEVGEDTNHTIKATKDGYQTAVQIITVKDSSPTLIQLDIDIYPASPTEGDLFTVTITKELDIVVGAEVIFNGETKTTDANGQVTFTAPDVGSDIPYTITATYENAVGSTIITVLNSPDLQLIINASTSVIEGKEFEILITAADGSSVEDAAVMFNDIIYSTNEDGIANPTAPYIEEDTVYQIVANKVGYTSATSTITITDRQLILDVDSFVIEGSEITATVTEEHTGNTIEGADVLFNSDTKQTGTDGKVTFVASMVDYTTDYTMKASMTGYAFAKETITVLLNQGGWIFGSVSDTFGALLEDVRICIKITSDTSRCRYSEEGRYVIPVTTPGTFTVEASKSEYKTGTTIAAVNENEAVEANFILEKKSEYQPEFEAEKEAMEYLIDTEIEKGIIGGKIAVEKEANHIQIYNEELQIEINEYNKNKKLIFTISAEDITNEIIVIKIDAGTFPDLTNLDVLYDGEAITKVGFNEILALDNDNSNAKWTSILVNDGIEGGTLYILLDTPLSEHTITIYSLVETISSVTILIFYAAIAIIVAIVFVGTGEITKRL